MIQRLMASMFLVAMSPGCPLLQTASDAGLDGAPADPGGGPDGAPADQGVPLDAETDALPELEIAQPPTVAEACSTRRLVGRTADNCPMLPAGSSWIMVPPVELRGQRYCQYHWPDASAPDLAQLPGGEAALDWLDADCHVVAALADPAVVRLALADDFEAAFANLIGSVPAAALPDRDYLPAPERLPVRVAVLDTSGEVVVGGISNRTPSYHGAFMASLIAQEGRPEEVDEHKALDVVKLDDDGHALIAGDDEGHFGFQGRLAETIVEAVDQWRASEGPRGHLIINISAGWDGRYNMDDGQIRSSVQFVFDALREARCAGALVIAAAGNDPGGPVPAEGPMFPAEWQKVPLDCQPDEPDPRPEEPLVYAVGGLDHGDQPLFNARRGGRPELGATAALATVELENGPSRLFTGSSVAAAVVSAAAALVWRYAPGLTAAEVMHTVWNSAEELRDPADFCLEPPPPANGCRPIRRVSICHAMSEAIAVARGVGVDCPGSVDAHSGSPPDFDAPDDMNVDEEHDADDLSESAEHPACGEDFALRYKQGARPVRDWCPDRQFYDGHVAPWAVVPQPSDDGCELCVLMDRTAVIGVSEAAGSLESVRLQTNAGEAMDLTSAFGLQALASGSTYKFSNLPFTKPYTDAKLVYVRESKGKRYAGSAQIAVKPSP